jgi:hypothetical protein
MPARDVSHKRGKEKKKEEKKKKGRQNKRNF